MKATNPIVYALSTCALAAAAFACGDTAPPKAPEDSTGAPPKSVYASDASITATGTTAEATPAPTSDASVPPKVVAEAGTTKGGDAGDGGSGACQALSLCCAQPKGCAEETAACDAVVQSGDMAQCAHTLAGYDIIGCGHDDSAPPPELPSFEGCDGY